MIDELGCTEENSFVIDFDLSNLDVKKIYEKAGKLTFKYEPKENKWLDILTGKSTYHYEAPNLVSIKVTKRYFDTVLDGRLMEVGTVYEVPEERAEKIINMGYAKYI